MKIKFVLFCSIFFCSFNEFYSGEYTWTGATSTFYDVDGNWSGGSAPSSSDNITIPNGLTNYPSVRTSISITDVTVNSGATLSISGSGTLTVTGTSSLTLTGVSGITEAGTLQGTFWSEVDDSNSDISWTEVHKAA